MRIICLFNLQAGVDIAEYEEWARTRDIPLVNGLPSVESFTVHRVTGLFGDPDARAPYDYIEVIDIRAMDAFLTDIASDAVQSGSAAFEGFAADPVFILTEDL